MESPIIYYTVPDLTRQGPDAASNPCFTSSTIHYKRDKVGGD